MKYLIDKKEKYSLIELHEEKLDSSISPKLKSEFITLNAEGVKNIILDLTNVKYVDSSGLSAILVANRICSEIDGTFVISGVSDHVMKLIKISQLESVLNLMPTKEEAIDSVFMEEIEKDLSDEDE